MKRLFVLAILLLTCSVRAQQKDYGKGFEKLHKLGLPKAAGARYGHLEWQARSTMFYGHSRVELKGNAWLLKENEDGTRDFLVDNCRVVTLTDRKALEKKRQAAVKAAGGDRKKLMALMQDMQEAYAKSGSWQEVDVKKDIEILNKHLAELKKQSTTNNRWRLESLSRSGAYGAWFLQAAQFHAAGETAAANQVVDTLFRLSGKPRDVIKDALNLLADSQYREAINAFADTKDWKSLKQELGAIGKRFGRNWDSLPGVTILMKRLDHRIANPAAPKLTAAGLTDEDHALATELAALGNDKAAADVLRSLSRLEYSETFWVLQPPEADDEKTPNVIDKICRRGMKAIPLLIALARDDFMLALVNTNDVTSMLQFRQSGADADVDPAVMAQRQFNALRRPLTRGDIAVKLLATIVSDRDHLVVNDEADVDRTAMVIDKAGKWHAANKDKKPLELARAMLDSGSRQQSAAALNYLIDKGAEEDLARIEARFLKVTTDDLSRQHYRIQQYLETRGKDGEAFARKYIARLKKLVAQLDKAKGDEARMQAWQKKEFERYIKQIESMYSKETVDDLLAKLVSGEKRFDEVGSILNRKLRQGDASKNMKSVLQAALTAKNPALQQQILGMLMYLRWHLREQKEEAEQKGEKPQTISPTTHAELWKQLLAVKKQSDPSGMGQSLTVGDMAAVSIEQMFGNPMAMRQLGQAFQFARERILAILHDRALARIAGKPDAELPKFPTPEKVSDDARKALVEKLLATAPEQVRPALAGLKLGEILALAANDQDEKLQKHLLPAVHEITKVTSNIELPAELKEAKGKQLTRKLVEALIELSREQVAKGKLVRATVLRKAAGAGVDINFSALAIDDPEAKSDPILQMTQRAYGDRSNFVTATVYCRRTYAQGNWQVKPAKTAAAKKTPKEEKKTPDDPDALPEAEDADLLVEHPFGSRDGSKNFWAKTDIVLSGKAGVIGQGAISVYGLPKPPGKPAE